MNFQLVLIKPQGFDFVESFREVMEVVQESLVTLGHSARIQTNRIDPDALPVIFGAHHIDPAAVHQLPPQSIIYNLEQLAPGYPWFSEQYLQTLTRFRVWDYSTANLEYLCKEGHSVAATHVPFGYSPCLNRILPAKTQDVDVLFFGIHTERRLRVLKALGESGLNVVALKNVWGSERDAWIARAKVVLNIHQADIGQFESVRVLFLLANGKAVVSETALNEQVDPPLRNAFCAVPYDELVAACQRLVDEPDIRAALQLRARAAAESDALRALPWIARAVQSLMPPDFQSHLQHYLQQRSPDYREFEVKPGLSLPFERIAFYLPQFHRCPENDEHWGAGFTEWNNVSRAIPRFQGHYQPRLPGELGYYDLAANHVLRRQVALAKNYGITGFMFFYYWLEGRPVLEMPVRNFFQDKDLDLKFYFMWANENWTRRWDGMEDEVLLRQHYSSEQALAMARHMADYFTDKRYLKVGNRPVLAVYRADLIPDMASYISAWTEACLAVGLDRPFLIMALSFCNSDPHSSNFDAALEYPPHPSVLPRTITPSDIRHRLQAFDPDFNGCVFHYDAKVESELKLEPPPFRTFRTAFPSWDNSARRKNGGSWTFAFSSPRSFSVWLRHLCRQEAQQADTLRMVCINAWNEWGEGAYLEPDARYGCAYLDAMHEAFCQYESDAPAIEGAKPSPNETERISAGEVRNTNASVLSRPPLGASTTLAVDSLRRDYIDLMRKCVIGMIHEDPPLEWNGSGVRSFDPQTRELGRDWPSRAQSMIGNRRMAQLQQAAEFALQQGIPGDFIETGVWRGGACIFLRAILRAYGDASRRVWLADSFAGLPPPDPEKYPADTGDSHHNFRALAVPMEEVQANFERYGLLDEQVRFLPGWFKDTLPQAPIEKLAILRLDGDMYESTMDALAALYPKVSMGGFVIVDDYGYIESCRRAVMDYRSQHGITEPIHDIDGMGVFWQRAR